MLDDKIKLEQYFEEEIKRVSDIEIAGIEQEIDEIRKNPWRAWSWKHNVRLDLPENRS